MCFIYKSDMWGSGVVLRFSVDGLMCLQCNVCFLWLLEQIVVYNRWMGLGCVHVLCEGSRFDLFWSKIICPLHCCCHFCLTSLSIQLNNTLRFLTSIPMSSATLRLWFKHIDRSQWHHQVHSLTTPEGISNPSPWVQPHPASSSSFLMVHRDIIEYTA